MLHSVPDLLEALEQRVMTGEDPLPLLGSIRWPELSGWPKDMEEAKALKRRLASLSALIHGLQAPLQATLLAFNDCAPYRACGTLAAPRSVSFRLSEHV